MLIAFIIALLLLAGTVAPTQGWLIGLVVASGASAMRLRPWAPLRLRPALDLRMAAFVLSILLLAGTIDATRDWLIGLSIATGLATFMPRLISLEGHDHRDRGSRRWQRWEVHHGRWHDHGSDWKADRGAWS